METLVTQSSVNVEFDSDYDGLEVNVPYCGIVSVNGVYTATLDIWNSGNWEVTDGELMEYDVRDVETQIHNFLKTQGVIG